MSIIVYTKKGCPWCKELLFFLQENNIDFDEREVLENEGFFEEMKNLSGQTLAPTVVVDGVVYPDTDMKEIKRILTI